MDSGIQTKVGRNWQRLRPTSVELGSLLLGSPLQTLERRSPCEAKNVNLSYASIAIAGLRMAYNGQVDGGKLREPFNIHRVRL